MTGVLMMVTRRHPEHARALQLAELQVETPAVCQPHILLPPAEQK